MVVAIMFWKNINAKRKIAQYINNKMIDTEVYNTLQIVHTFIFYEVKPLEWSGI
jgi:hypothetical protein